MQNVNCIVYAVAKQKNTNKTMQLLFHMLLMNNTFPHSKRDSFKVEQFSGFARWPLAVYVKFMSSVVKTVISPVISSNLSSLVVTCEGLPKIIPLEFTQSSIGGSLDY